MKTINRYILADFAVMFSMTLLIFTFIMCLGVVVKAIDFAARGISGDFIAKIFFYNIPYMFTFSIPMSVLTTVLLLFGRLSFDGELNAMKASGLSMWHIVAPVILSSILLSVVCLYISTSLAPQCRHAVRMLFSEIRVDEPVNLLEPGRYVRDFPGMLVYVGEREGNKISDISVYEMGENGPERIVKAVSGLIRADTEAKILNVDLYKVRIDHMEVDKETQVPKSHYVTAEFYPVQLDFSRFQKKGARTKTSDMTFIDLIQAIRNIRQTFPELRDEDLLRQRMTMVVEANKRLALSLSCLAFTFIGIPLGMKSKRKESTIGIGISLLLVFAFYLFIILANSLVSHPQLRPDLIVWLPVIVAEIAGFILISRTN